MNDTEKALLRTILFFDCLDYPLTLFELWKNAYVPQGSAPSFDDVVRILLTPSALGDYVDTRNGVYFLKGRQELADIRSARMIAADEKYRIARTMIRVLAHVPFVRMVCVCNTVGMGAAKEESDIDLFIVARAGHVWLVRLLCTGYVHLLGRRPRGVHVRDTLCLSFYASDDALDFSSIAEHSHATVPDIYFLYWMTWCVPLYDDGVYELFVQSNDWVRTSLPNAIRQRPSFNRRIVLSRLGHMVKKGAEKTIGLFGNFFERCARNLQYALMPSIIREKAHTGTSVIISNSILKFHTTDRRSEIRETFIQKCRTRDL